MSSDDFETPFNDDSNFNRLTLFIQSQSIPKVYLSIITNISTIFNRNIQPPNPFKEQKTTADCFDSVLRKCLYLSSSKKLITDSNSEFTDYNINHSIDKVMNVQKTT